MAQFPTCMPDSGERVPADPANMIRDVFLANKGRIRADLVDNMIARHAFTYGWAIHDAWVEMSGEDGWFAVRDGADWVVPIQEAWS